MKNIKHLRWWIIALVCMGTILNYLARNSLGVLAPTLEKELHFSTAQYSYIVGAFQLAYTLMQPVCGYIVDHIGLRVGFAIFAVAWSITNMLHAFAAGWPTLAFFRGMLGLSEAAAIPSGMKAIAEWFPARERSVATGWLNAGTSLGALIAPPVVIGLSLAYDWRVAFVVTGGLGLGWAALWYGFYRSPADHFAITPDEQAMIEAGRPSLVRVKRATARDIVATPRFWAIAIPRFLAEPAWQTFSFWIPLYLATERGMDIKQIAIFAWLPFLAADLGGVFGGYLSPILMKHFGTGLIPSRVAGVAIGAVLMIAPGCIGLAGDPYLAIALFSVGGFAHQMISVMINTLSADVFTPSEVATANGFVGMAGWTGGLLFSLAIGQLADRIGYGPLFACLAVFDLIGAAALILMMKRLYLPSTPGIEATT